jgi:two-component system, LytTR family, response regulator
VNASRIRVLVVDDEPLARRGVMARLARHPDVELAGECATGREAVRAIAERRPDVVFLDVQMPGMDGFGVVEAVGVERMPLTVFLTAHDTHALRAFEVQASDYLLKPIDDERFDAAIARMRRRLAEQRPAPSKPERLVIRDRGRMVLLAVEEVDWVGAEKDYVRVYVRGRSHLVRETMSAMESQLPAAQFARIHRSAIVNLARIRELRPQANREFTVVLRDGTQLRLSRSYRDRLATLIEG